MSTIIGLLALWGAAIAVIVIGIRASLYFHEQDLSRWHSITAQQTRASTEEQTTLERYAQLYSADTSSTSSRYAWTAIAVVALVILIAILVIVGIVSGVLF